LALRIAIIECVFSPQRVIMRMVPHAEIATSKNRHLRV